MIVLSGQTLTAAGKIRPEGMSLSLEERNSTATLTVGPDAPDISVGTWLKDDTNPGAGIVWRVKSIEERYGEKSRELQLEHIISTLKDGVIFGEITPKEIKNSNSATTCTALEAVQYILGKQSLWQLNTSTFGYGSVSRAYKFNGDTLYDALETVSETLDDAEWSYDLSSTPFVLSIKPRSSAVTCEMRAGRNITSMSRTVDRSSMYTRLYPIGKDDLHINGLYVSQNEGTYGTICKIETESSIDTAAELTAWANDRLSRHAHPDVRIQIDGLELARETGESLDTLTLGRKCRCPLPEYGTTIIERIVKLEYQDKIFAPEVVRITLSNTQADVVRMLADEIKKSSKSGRRYGRQSKDDHAWIEDTDDHVSIIAEKTFGDKSWQQISDLTVSGDGIYGTATLAHNGMVENKGRLIVEHDRTALLTEVHDNREILRYASYSKFPTTGNSSKIYLDISTEKYYEWKQVNGTYQYSEIAKDDVHKVKVAGLVNAINNNNETVSIIKADHIAFGSQNSGHLLTGAFDYDPNTGNLYIADAGGLYVKRTQTVEGVETNVYSGVWDKGELTGGMMVTQINGQTTTRIKGNKINIGNSDNSSDVSINDAFEIYTYSGVQSVKIKKQFLVQEKNAYVLGGNLTVSPLNDAGGTITGDELHVGTGGSLVFNDRNNDTSVTRSDVIGFLDTYSHVALTGPVSNVYTLWYMPNKTALTLENSTPSTANGWLEVGTFSRAVTGYGYSWGNPKDGRLTVTAQPQGYSAQLLGVTDGGGSWSGNTFTGKIKYYEGSDDETTYETGATYTVDGLPRYKAGWNGARGNMVIPTTSIGSYIDGSYDEITVEKPKADGASGTDSYVYELNVNDTFRPSGATSDVHAVELKYGSTVVARKTLSGYYTTAERNSYGSTQYTAGRNDTKVSSTFTWEHSGDYTDDYKNTLTVTTDAPNPVSGASKSLTLYLAQGSWGENNKAPAYITTGSPNGTKRAALEINGIYVYNKGWNESRDAMVIPTDSIESYIDGNYAKLIVQQPKAAGESGTESYEYTILVNDSFRPQGASADIYAVELKYGNSVVARKDINYVYEEGRDAVINAGGAITRTTDGTVTLNQYVTTLTVNTRTTTYNDGYGDAIDDFNIPKSSIGNNIDGNYANFVVSGPNGMQYISTGEWEQETWTYYLNINNNFRPTGTTTDIRAVELKLGNTVVARKTLTGGTTPELFITESFDGNQMTIGRSTSGNIASKTYEVIAGASVGMNAEDNEIIISYGGYLYDSADTHHMTALAKKEYEKSLYITMQQGELTGSRGEEHRDIYFYLSNGVYTLGELGTIGIYDWGIGYSAGLIDGATGGGGSVQGYTGLDIAIMSGPGDRYMGTLQGEQYIAAAVMTNSGWDYGPTYRVPAAETHTKIDIPSYQNVNDDKWTCSIQKFGDEKYYTLSCTIGKNQSIAGLSNGSKYVLYK